MQSVTAPHRRRNFFLQENADQRCKALRLDEVLVERVVTTAHPGTGREPVEELFARTPFVCLGSSIRRPIPPREKMLRKGFVEPLGSARGDVVERRRKHHDRHIQEYGDEPGDSDEIENRHLYISSKTCGARTAPRLGN